MVKMRALGIDPGTSSFDVCCIEGIDHIVLNESLPTDRVAKAPGLLFDIIQEAAPDVLVGPSAMGVPCKHISQLSPTDIAYATLAKNTEVDIAIRRFIKMLQQSDPPYNAFFVPSVIQLPTVPSHRKTNKVDMGTADKTCITALAIWEHSEEHNIPYHEANFILVELGFGFNACIAVQQGKIIDGIGGTLFPGPGYLTMGAMDLEFAHILGRFSERQLALGGASYIALDTVILPEKYAHQINSSNFQAAWETLVEGVVKAIAMEATILKKDSFTEILLSGRLSRVETLSKYLTRRLEDIFDLSIRQVKGFTSDSKEAAQGAALIANGLGQGRFKQLVKVMELTKAEGSVLDYIRWPSFDPTSFMQKKIESMLW